MTRYAGSLDSGFDRPVFIVGLPRSGTSVLYEKLALHPAFACLTQNTRKFPRSEFLSRVYSRLRRNPKPTEAPRVWSRAARAEDDRLTAADATEPLIRYYREVVFTQLRLAGKSRFLSKYPRNGLRMDFLDAIFPGCLFIHCIRDGRAVTRSILEKRETHGGRGVFWGIRPPGWRDLLSLDPVEAVGIQYERSLAYIRSHATPYLPDRYIEVRYEEFCDDPKAMLTRLGTFCGLRWDADRLDQASAGVRSCNDKWRSLFGASDLATLDRTIGPVMRELGYEV